MDSNGLNTLPARNPVSVHGSIQFDLPSAMTGRTYRIFVFQPAAPPPPGGYPVIVATDGNMTFPILATTAAMFALTCASALVVGVGYPTDDPVQLFSLRTRDLTPPTPLSGLPQRPGQPPARIEDYGGAEDFHRFLVEELRPMIAGAYPVSANDQTLYGHSWGGLFTLGVLFDHPKSFRSFVASSPSIWWNKCAVLGHVSGFEQKIQSEGLAPRVLISVGAAEEDVPATLPPAITHAVAEKAPVLPAAVRNTVARFVTWRMMRKYRMVNNARSLAARLRRINGRADYTVRFHAFDDEDHLTVLPASISRAVTFALRPAG